MAWIFNKITAEDVTDEFTKELISLVGEKSITQLLRNKKGDIDGLLLENGQVIVNIDSDPTFISYEDYFNYPKLEYFVLHQKEVEWLLLRKYNEDPSALSTEEYYLFGDIKYNTKEELLAEIKSYAGKDGGTYYYTHHTEKEYCVEIDSSEKVIGEYDQSTLDKVNKILKAKGVDFVIKGE